MPGVVVGVGRAGRSGPALRWASAEAEVRSLSLTLVHAWNEPLNLSLELDPGSLPDVPCAATSCAARGPVAEVLFAHCPDVLVLGGRRGTAHLSGVTRACLDQASCPVVIVPDVEHPVTRRVVVGVNGSPASHAALIWAAREARLQSATLVVIHAWQVRPTSASHLLRPSRAVPQQQIAALGRLHGWVHDALGPAPRTVPTEVQAAHGGPLDRLLEASVEADLLVLGRGVPKKASWLVRSTVSDDLSALVPCPIAVIPARATSTATRSGSPV